MPQSIQFGSESLNLRFGWKQVVFDLSSSVSIERTAQTADVMMMACDAHKGVEEMKRGIISRSVL